MPGDNSYQTSRRNYLKTVGAAGTVSLAGLSGCLQGSGGEELTEVSTVSVPAIMGGSLAWDGWINDTGGFNDRYPYPFHDDGLQARWEDHGYDINYQQSWDESTLLASRQVDFATTDPIGAIQLGRSQDQQLTIFANTLTNLHGWCVQADSPYDPANTGSVQASLDALVEDEGVLGIRGWEASSFFYQQVILEKRYGYRLVEDGGDFENVQTVDYGAVPSLLERGELDAAVVLPAGGGGYNEITVEQTITPLWWDMNVFIEEGWGYPMLQNMTVHTDFWEEEPEACRLLLEDWNAGQRIFLQNLWDITLDETWWDAIGASTEDEARWITELNFSGESDIQESCVPYPIALDDGGIDKITSAVGHAEDIGSVESGWEDYLTLVHMDEILDDHTPEPL